MRPTSQPASIPSLDQADLCCLATIADRFAIYRRTLSRHLRAEGVGFQSLVDETRFESRARG